MKKNSKKMGGSVRIEGRNALAFVESLGNRHIDTAEAYRRADQKIADFKLHIAALMRGSDPDTFVKGAPHAHPCVVRKPGDRGYNKEDTR
jgi:hypothetical protein